MKQHPHWEQPPYQGYPPPPYPYQQPQQKKAKRKQHQEQQKAHQIDWPSFLVGVLVGIIGLYFYAVLGGGQ